MRAAVFFAVVLALLALACHPASGSSLYRRRMAQGILSESLVGDCVDVRPKGSEQYSCEEQKGWGKCGESWMAGFCKKTCGQCSPAAPSAPSAPSPAAPSAPSAPAAPATSASVQALGIIGRADQSAPIHSYGASYRTHKVATYEALVKSGMTHPQVVLCMAIGMLETNTFSPDSRDKAKTGDSTNYSAFNVNRDMLRTIGITADDSLNTFAGLPKVAAALKKAIAQLGVNGFLNFHRGGSTGYNDGVSYGCADYRRGIASMVRMIDAQPALLTDDRRIDLVVQHV